MARFGGPFFYALVGKRIGDRGSIGAIEPVIPPVLARPMTFKFC
jgi:hypothetical protein